MKILNKKSEEYKHLMKIKVVNQGKNQYQFKPDSTKTGDNITGKGTFTFRGSIEELAKFLRKLKAKDNQTDPPSIKNITYMQMATEISNGSDPYIWIWNDYWKSNKKPMSYKKMYGEAWQPDVYTYLKPEDLEYLGKGVDYKSNKEFYLFQHKKYDKTYRTDKNNIICVQNNSGGCSAKTNLTLDNVRFLIKESINIRSLKSQLQKISEVKSNLAKYKGKTIEVEDQGDGIAYIELNGYQLDFVYPYEMVNDVEKGILVPINFTVTPTGTIINENKKEKTMRKKENINFKETISFRFKEDLIDYLYDNDSLYCIEKNIVDDTYVGKVSAVIILEIRYSETSGIYINGGEVYNNETGKYISDKEYFIDSTYIYSDYLYYLEQNIKNKVFYTKKEIDNIKNKFHTMYKSKNRDIPYMPFGESKKVVEIEKAVRVNNIILEKGDKIEILKENIEPTAYAIEYIDVRDETYNISTYYDKKYTEVLIDLFKSLEKTQDYTLREILWKKIFRIVDEDFEVNFRDKTKDDYYIYGDEVYEVMNNDNIFKI